MNSRSAFLILTLILTQIFSPLSPDAHGEDSTLSFDAAEARAFALQNSRELRVAALEIKRAKSRLRWAGRLDNPELELAGISDVIGNRDDEGLFEIAFSQRFPVTSRLKDEREVRRVGVVLAEAEMDLHRRELVSEVDKAVVELVALERANAFREKLADLNTEIVEYLEGRAAVGEVSPLDVAQAALSGKALGREIGRFRAEEMRAKMGLKQLLGLDPDRSVEVKGDFSLPDGAPTQRFTMSEILGRRPDYGATLVKQDLAKAELVLAKSSRWEDIGLKFFLENEWSVDEPEGRDRNTFAGVGVSIPLPIRKKNEEAIEAAGIDLESAGLTRDALTFNIHSEMEAALKERAAAYQLAKEASGDILDLAEKNLEEHRKAYTDGLARLVEVQRAQEQLLEIQNAAVDLRRDYYLADARVRYVSANYPELRMTKRSPNQGMRGESK